MKLYVAKCEFDYEGFDIIGIFDSEDKAEAACKAHTYKDGTTRGDSKSVEVFELNEAIPNV